MIGVGLRTVSFLASMLVLTGGVCRAQTQKPVAYPDAL